MAWHGRNDLQRTWSVGQLLLSASRILFRVVINSAGVPVWTRSVSLCQSGRGFVIELQKLRVIALFGGHSQAPPKFDVFDALPPGLTAFAGERTGVGGIYHAVAGMRAVVVVELTAVVSPHPQAGRRPSRVPPMPCGAVGSNDEDRRPWIHPRGSGFPRVSRPVRDRGSPGARGRNSADSNECRSRRGALPTVRATPDDLPRRESMDRLFSPSSTPERSSPETPRLQVRRSNRTPTDPFPGPFPSDGCRPFSFRCDCRTHSSKSASCSGVPTAGASIGW